MKKLKICDYCHFETIHASPFQHCINCNNGIMWPEEAIDEEE